MTVRSVNPYYNPQAANGRFPAAAAPARTMQESIWSPQTRNMLSTMGTAPQGSGYTSGPVGSSGGLTGAPQGNQASLDYMQQAYSDPRWGGQSQTGAPMQQPTQYGYGQSPSQGGLGYYEQQTPVGSFAAANQQRSAPQAPVQQQYAGTAQASNPYIGQQTGSIQGPNAVSGQFSPYSNPYLGQTSQQAQGAGSNPYGGGNPYLGQSVNAALGQAADSYKATVLPQFDRMSRASGSFGNTGVEAARQRSMDAFGQNQANAATNAYMQDYTQQQGLAENALNRTQQNNQFNAGLGAADLGRNLAGGFTQAGMNNQYGMQGAMFDASNQMQTNQFNAGLQQNDLSRQTNAALGLGTFNAGALNNMGQFNASQGNQMGQFNANLGQQNSHFNTSQGNQMNLANTGWANSMLENGRNRTQQQGQFDANLDRGIWNDNMGWMRQGQQDQIGLMNSLMNWGQQGVGNATAIQNTPLQYLQQFANLGQGLGGMGGTNSQNYQGNPLLGLLGGWQAGSQLFGGNQRAGG